MKYTEAFWTWLLLAEVAAILIGLTAGAFMYVRVPLSPWVLRLASALLTAFVVFATANKFAHLGFDAEEAERESE